MKTMSSCFRGKNMDYDWKYFIDDLKDGKIDIKPIVSDIHGNVMEDITGRLSKEKKRQVKNLIKGMFYNYRTQKVENCCIIEELMKAHTNYCKANPQNEQLKRRHNAVIYRYMMKTAFHKKAIAIKLDVSFGTIQNDISQTMEEIMILCFGIPVGRCKPNNLQEAVKCLFRSYQLLKLSQEIETELMWKEWQQLRVESLKKTSRVIEYIEKAVRIYEAFIASSSCPDMQKRALEVVRRIYLNDNSNISEMAAVYQVSEKIIYSDINKIVERFTELFEIMSQSEKRLGVK